MNTIQIGKRTYSPDQAHYLLRHNGWKDDVEGFLSILDGLCRYCEIRAFKKHFREWRRDFNAKLNIK